MWGDHLMRTMRPDHGKHGPGEMKEHKSVEEPRRLLQHWDTGVRWMMRLCVSFVILVVAAQCLLLIGGLRHYICPVERLEGIPYKQAFSRH